MSDTVAKKKTDGRLNSWFVDNQSYLGTQLRRLRLVLQRRVLWLRRRWRNDPLHPYQGMVISEAQADWLLAGGDRKAEASFHQDDQERRMSSRTPCSFE